MIQRSILFFAMAIMVIVAGCARIYTGMPLAEGLGAHPNVVHYDVDSGNTGKRPDFRGTIVQLCFTGNVADQAKATLLKLGARDFIKRSAGNVKGFPAIRFSIGPCWKYPVNDGYYWGNIYATPVYARLVKKDGTTILLGSAVENVFAGSTPYDNGGGLNWCLRYGWMAPAGLSPDLASGLSVARGIDTLLCGDGWMPGAYEAVRSEFRQDFLKKKS